MTTSAAWLLPSLDFLSAVVGWVGLDCLQLTNEVEAEIHRLKDFLEVFKNFIYYLMSLSLRIERQIERIEIVLNRFSG